jgi:hypothetical protein
MNVIQSVLDDVVSAALLRAIERYSKALVEEH